MGSKRIVEMGEEHRHALDNDDLFGIEDAGERKLLSRYGIWLLVELCHPQHDIPIVSLCVSSCGHSCVFCNAKNCCLISGIRL